MSAEIHWEGDSKEVLSRFPRGVKVSLGYSLSKIGNVIYILHCFEKSSRKTERRDLVTARTRLRQVLDRIQKEKAREKRSQ